MGRPRPQIEIGTRFHDWTVEGAVVIKNKRTLVPCRCVCGEAGFPQLVSLKNGTSTRCRPCAQRIAMARFRNNKKETQVLDSKQLILEDNGNGIPAITPLTILENVAKEFHVAKWKLKAAKRSTRRVHLGRDELCRRLRVAGYTHREIGEFLSGRSGNGVCMAVRRAEARLVEAVCS
jgi:hypothetical protein